MKEAAVVVDKQGRPLHWHIPTNRTGVALPDSRPLWDVLWEHREALGGVAHSHPGSGIPGPSHEDVTTFEAVEKGLGRRLDWWISSSNHLVLVRWVGPGPFNYRVEELVTNEPLWLGRLRKESV